MESLFDSIWEVESIGGKMPGEPSPMVETCMVCLCLVGPLPGSGGGIELPSFIASVCKDEG